MVLYILTAMTGSGAFIYVLHTMYNDSTVDNNAWQIGQFMA